jgi:hypothetical protein
MPGAVFISVRRGGVVRGRVFGSAGASPSRVGERVVVFGSAGASPSRGGVRGWVVFGSAGASPSRGGVRGLVEFGSAGASPSRGGRAREAGLSHEDSADDLSDGFYVLNTDKFLVQS